MCAPLANDDSVTNGAAATRTIRSPMNGVIEEPDVVSCDHFVQWIKLVN